MTDVNVMVPAAQLRTQYEATRPRHSFNDILDRDERLTAMQQLVDARLTALGTLAGWEAYLSGVARFPHLSPANILLVLDQHPTATRLSSHRGWANVQRVPVERGIAVLAPSLRQRRRGGHPLWDGGRPVQDEVRHRPTTVFDYSSTAGAHLEPVWDERADSPREGFVDDLRAAAAAIGFAVEARRTEVQDGRLVLALIHGQTEQQRARKLARDLGVAAAGEDGADVFAYALGMANGMLMPPPPIPADPLAAVASARTGLHRVLQRTTFRNMS